MNEWPAPNAADLRFANGETPAQRIARWDAERALKERHRFDYLANNGD